MARAHTSHVSRGECSLRNQSLSLPNTRKLCTCGAVFFFAFDAHKNLYLRP